MARLLPGLHSLYLKLVLVLFLLFAIVGGVFLAVAMHAAPMYQQEVSQQLNRDLAAHVVERQQLIDRGEVRRENLRALFADVMIINPSLELYLLDAGGRVIAHSLPPQRVVRQQVSLVPIQHFLETADNGLIMGDDPADAARQNAFSVAPIDVGGRRQGYVYAILGSEKFTHVLELLQRSLILQWSALVLLFALSFAFIAGLLLFYFLMRKLRVLGRAMQAFRRDNLDHAGASGTAAPDADTRGLDEIDAMAATFAEMSRRMLEQVNRLRAMETQRRELIANVSHDLRTPLAALGGYLETLQLKSASLDEAENKHCLRIAHANAQRLGRLVDELFELAKLDADEISPRPESFSPAELAFDLSHKFYLRAREQRIEFEVVADESLPWVDADLGMIERVLDNLIDNSFRFTPAEGRIRLELTSRADQVEIAVSDTGAGIAEHELPRVLERYYRRPEAQDEHGGLGLGLAIAARMVELHGGRLSVESRLHEGSTFRFSLPAHPLGRLRDGNLTTR